MSDTGATAQGSQASSVRSFVETNIGVSALDVPSLMLKIMFGPLTQAALADLSSNIYIYIYIYIYIALAL